MDIDLITQFIRPDMMIIAAACYVFGIFIKSSTIDDWIIPFILLIFAIVLSIVYIAFVLDNGITVKVVINGIIQGLFAAALSVYGNQVIKQVTKK